jgi:hypothetical protein
MALLKCAEKPALETSMAFLVHFFVVLSMRSWLSDASLEVSCSFSFECIRASTSVVPQFGYLSFHGLVFDLGDAPTLATRGAACHFVEE